MNLYNYTWLYNIHIFQSCFFRKDCRFEHHFKTIHFTLFWCYIFFCTWNWVSKRCKRPLFLKVFRRYAIFLFGLYNLSLKAKIISISIILNEYPTWFINRIKLKLYTICVTFTNDCVNRQRQIWSNEKFSSFSCRSFISK